MTVISEFFGMIVSNVLECSQPSSLPCALWEIFDIATGKRIKGRFSKRGEKLVSEWAKLNKKDLEKSWELCVKKNQPLKIKPLS